MVRLGRQQEILRILAARREVSVQFLTERFGVSEATVRKDLTLLEEMGFLVRSHGGAVLAEDRRIEEPLEARKTKALAEKVAIARRARELVREGDTIFLDSGSTCALLARELRDMNLRVISHSLGVFEELKNAPGVSLFALGGSYRKDAESFIGPLAIESLRHFQIETCFVGAASFTEEGVFSSQNIIEGQLKAEVLKASRRRVIVADHTKAKLPGFSVFARPGDFDLLVTDNAFPFAEQFRRLGIEVMLG